MAFAPVADIAPQYEDFPNYWLKFFEQGTVVPKSMATSEDGSTLLAKAEVSGGGGVNPPIGFFQTTGGDILIPYVSGTYDAWLFPTEADADANDTSNAEQIADNQGGSVSVTESQTLAGGQVTVTFSSVDTGLSQFYLSGINADNGRLTASTDYTIISSTQIQLTQSCPSETVITGVESGGGSGDFLSTLEKKTVISSASGAVTLDAQNGSVTIFDVQIAGNITDLSVINSPSAGGFGINIKLEQTGAGGFTTVFNSQFNDGAAVASQLTTTTGSYDWITALTIDNGVKYDTFFSGGPFT